MATPTGGGRLRDVVVETYRRSIAQHRSQKRPRTYARVHKLKGFSLDECSPGMVSLWKVTDVESGDEALALIAERAAGVHHENVKLVVGHGASETQL